MQTLIAFFRFYQKQLVKSTIGVLALLILLPFALLVNYPDGRLHLYFFDVGQGDSIFIRTPQNYQILIDGGPSEKVVWELSKIMPFYDRSLDLVVLTHPHADHVDGLMEVMKRYQVKKVLANKISYTSPDYQEFWRVINKQKIPHDQFLAGDSIRLPDGVSLASHWPRAQTDIFEILDVNRASIVVRLSLGTFSALLAGDAELGRENPELASRLWEKVDVLKIPHHGSKDAVSEEALKRLQPVLAVISVGQNRFGHPAGELIELLEKTGSRVLRTDEQGTIEVVVDKPGNWQVKF